MSISYLILVIFQVASIVAVSVLWLRTTKIQNQEDQRLSKGLQLLQSKLAVLEDLSDRTEVQVNQLIAILESKIKEIQEKLIDADKVIGKIEKNISKSLEVANIFQDKIPHQEILERQYTKKYVKAAQLAHAGHSAEEIAQVVELTRGEIELIVKLNREQLQFEFSELPEWAKEEMNEQVSHELDLSVPTIFENKTDTSPLRSLESAFEVPQVDSQNLRKLGDQFRTAMAQTPNNTTGQTMPAPYQAIADERNSKISSRGVSQMFDNNLLNTFSRFFDTEPQVLNQPPVATEEVIVQGGKRMTVKPFQFKKIEDDAQA